MFSCPRRPTPPSLSDPEAIIRSILLSIVLAGAALPIAAFTVEGVVVDRGRPVEGVRVTLLEARIGTITDSSGHFLLEAADPNPPAARFEPRWTLRDGAVEIRASESIRRATLSTLDGRIVGISTPDAPTSRLPVPGRARRPLVLEIRTAAGTWTSRILEGTTRGGAGWMPRDFATRDSLVLYSIDRPIARLEVFDSSRQLRLELPKGRWVAGDFHTHSVLSDGSQTQIDVMAHALGGTFPFAAADGSILDSTTAGFGLDWVANTDHGGSFCRNPDGAPWPASVVPLGSPPSGCLWRWQSLLQWSWPRIDSLRRVHPGKTIVQGLEWNVPGHEHSSVGILSRSGREIATFEYLFDANDRDTDPSGGAAVLEPGVAKSPVNDHQKAVAGIRWLQANHRDSAYLLVNHPSRILANAVTTLRDFQDAGPDVFLGIEAMPGHPWAWWRGGYSFWTASVDSLAFRTRGGADAFLAQLGGVADAMWSEGRPLRIFANSDFHLRSETGDAWPGEYARNRHLVTDSTGSALLAALKAGRGFCQTGDLVAEFDLLADDGHDAARMGSELRRRNPADSITLILRWKPSLGNFHGQTPVPDHFDVIEGSIGSRALPGTAAYSRGSVEGVSVAQRLLPRDFSAPNPEGWREARLRILPKGPRYYRIRATSLPPATPLETDSAGNPLADSEGGANTSLRAWSDLWLYTNPVSILR